MAFNKDAALQAGYTEQEVNDYIASKKNIGSNVIKSLGSLAGGTVRTGLKVLQAPSDLLGGALKATRETISGDYQAPKTGIRLPPREGYPKGMDIGETFLPTLVGAARGVRTGQSPVMTELPTTLGINPESTAGLALGLTGEILTPDLGDALKIGKATQKGTKLAGNFLEAGGENFALRGIKANPSQLDKFQKATGKELQKFITEEGLAGNVLQNTIEKASKLQDDFDQIALNTDIRVPAENIVQKFKDKIDSLESGLAGLTKTGTVKELSNFLDEITERVTMSEDGAVGLDELTRLRRAVDEQIPKQNFLQWLSGKEIAPKIELRNLVQDIIQDATAGIKSPSGLSLDELGTKLKGLYNVESIAQRQSLLGKGTNIIGLTTALGALTGAQTGENTQQKVKNALIGASFGAVANNPKVVSAVSNVLINGGGKLKNSKAFPKLIELIIRAGKEGAINKTRAITSTSPQE